MSITRKPVRGQHNETYTPGQRGDMSGSTVRLVSEPPREPNEVEVSLDNFDANNMAPALSSMNLNERTGSDVDGEVPRTQSGTSHQKTRIARSSLDKPLPDTPEHHGECRHESDEEHTPRFRVGDRRTHGKRRRARRDTARDENVLDFEDSEETIYHRHQTPAVVHETIQQPTHEIKHEIRERDIHNHHVHHRVLPVHEVEVLPARHFVQDAQGRRREISACDVPGREPEFSQRLLTECFKDTLPKMKRSAETRGFTARVFPGTKGDYRKAVDPTGTVHTEKCWIYPPTLEQAGANREEAYPVHFD